MNAQGLPTKVLTNRARLSPKGDREAFFPMAKTMRIVTPTPDRASDDAMERKKHEQFFDRAYVPHRRTRRHKKLRVTEEGKKK